MKKERTDRQERMRLGGEARNAALQRLRELYPDAYRKIYEEEAKKRGIEPQWVRTARRIQRLESELKALRRPKV